MPSVLIAAVIPVFNLSSALRDYQVKLFVRNQYSTYANTLLEAGQLDRASKVMSEIDATDKFDARSQYATAKLLTRIAIVQGKRQQEAIDRTNVLLMIQNHRPFYFPRLGGQDELLDLELALLDIQIQLQLFDEASSRIESLMRTYPASVSRVNHARIIVRRGTLKALRFDTAVAKQDLTDAAEALEGVKPAELAESFFQLAKLYQLNANDRKKAMELYARSRELFERLGDKFGLIKVLNNTGMLYIDWEDLRNARASFELEQRATVQVGDAEGLARSLVNLAIVARQEGSFPEAVRLATEALTAFKESGNKRGLAAAYQSLSNSFSRMGDVSKALINARQALELFEDVRDLRGVRGTMGVLADLCVSGEEWSEAIFYLHGAIRLRDYLGETDTPLGRRDTDINLASLRSILSRLGSREYTKIAASAESRLTNVLEHLEIKGVTAVLNRRDLVNLER